MYSEKGVQNMTSKNPFHSKKIFNKKKNFSLKKKIHIRSGSRVWTQINLDLDREFNFIHFGIEINKRLKLLTLKNVWV